MISNQWKSRIYSKISRSSNPERSPIKQPGQPSAEFVVTDSHGGQAAEEERWEDEGGHVSNNE